MVEIVKAVVVTDEEAAAVGIAKGDTDWWPKIQPLLRAGGFAEAELKQAIMFRQDDNKGTRFEVRA